MTYCNSRKDKNNIYLFLFIGVISDAAKFLHTGWISFLVLPANLGKRCNCESTCLDNGIKRKIFAELKPEAYEAMSIEETPSN